eukprot:COSAG03_NODE_22032_length_296_cov_0.776650_1_plen_31_part_10
MNSWGRARTGAPDSISIRGVRHVEYLLWIFD